MKYSDLFRTAAAVALSITVAAVPAMAKNGNPKLAKPTSAGPKAKAPKAQAAKAPSVQAPRPTTQKPQVSSTAAARPNTKPTTSARRSSVNSKFYADPASGFKNSGQYRATVNNANNLGLDFWVLKDLMVNQGMSLGQAKKAAKAMGAPRPSSTVTPRRPSTTAPRPPSTTNRPETRPSTTKPSTTAPRPPSTTNRPETKPSTTNRPVDPAAPRPSTSMRKVKDKS